MPDETNQKREKDGSLSYRSATVMPARAEGPATIDRENRSVEIAVATEAPTLVYDYDRGRIFEVLLMSGAQLPESRQIVMLDAHSRYETADVIGSARQLKITSSELIGRAYFSTAPEAEGPWIKTAEGHLTDFSVGYRVDEAVWIPEGTTSVIDGRTFTGPLQVATKWIPREVSAVPIGADEYAKARSIEAITPKTEPHHMEETNMDERLRKFLERSGLPVTATEEDAWKFFENLPARTDTTPATPAVDLDKIRAEATGVERQRINDIDALCQRYEMPEVAREGIIKGLSLDQVREIILDKVIERGKQHNPGFSGVRLEQDERDKFRATAMDALCLKADFTIEKPAPGAQELRGYTLVEMARECLRMANLKYSGLPMDMVGRAMTSSDFPYLLANLATKSVMQGWETAAETWQIWCGIGSVSDFKTYYDIALSELSDLEEIPDTGEYKYGKFTEKRESYAIATYGKLFAITRVMIINDDLGALTELPNKRGEAAARKVGDVAYAVLTGNGTMGDGHAIFDSTNHVNDAVSGYLTAPGIASLAEGIRAMKSHKDLQGLRRLNIRPQYLIGPAAIEGAAEVFFKSDKFADSDTVATDSSLAATRANPYSGTYFTRVYEPRLDDDSAAAWYLAGPKGKTVKVVFLNGQQSPFVEMKDGWNPDGVEYKVRIDVGAYAVDYRGMYRNEGE